MRDMMDYAAEASFEGLLALYGNECKTSGASKMHEIQKTVVSSGKW